MLYAMGISLDALGVPTRDGSRTETDHRKCWQIFADHFYLFSGTPTGVWLNHIFYEVFGIREKLSSRSAQKIYDEIQDKLSRPEFLPRALFDRFNIEVLTTTDGAADGLDHHKVIRDSGWKGNVIPCFRPDAVFAIAATDWKKRIHELSRAGKIEVTSYATLVQALEQRRAFFKSMGAVSTDHAVLTPRTHGLSLLEAEGLFRKAMRGEAAKKDEAAFEAHMLMESARMSVEDGLVMQLHPGSFRNHNKALFQKYGPDKGADIPVATEYTRNLGPLLNRFGNDTRFTLIVFTLDESAYSRELAPLAGHYPALKLGPPWWFHDSIEGMARYRKRITETAGIYNTVGFNDDTRSFPSVPARHDLARRMDANFVAGLAARHIIDLEEGRTMVRALTYDLVKKAYKLK
jgi:glucuronate isomerase